MAVELVDQAQMPVAQSWWLGAQQYVLAAFSLLAATIVALITFIFRRSQRDAIVLGARVKVLEDERITLTQLTGDVRMLVDKFNDFQTNMENHHTENKKIRQDDMTENRRWREDVFAAMSTSVTQNAERIAALQDRVYSLENAGRHKTARRRS